MSIPAVASDVNLIDLERADNNVAQRDNRSVFSTALPYGVGSLLVGGVSTYVAIVTYTAGSPILAAIASVAALIGTYSFFVTAYNAIYSNNSTEFEAKIVPALKVTAFAVVTEVISLVAKVIIEKIIRDLVFGANS